MKKSGWFLCLWNHRDLSDPIQAEIEKIIRKAVPSYGYGARRYDQTFVIQGSGLFSNITQFEGAIKHTQTVAECVEAWRSHATLSRQAEAVFSNIIDTINSFLETLEQPAIEIPYTTVGWLARKS